MLTYSNKNWGPIPTAGDLNQRIRILAMQNTLDADGYAEETEKQICRVWAQVVQSGDSTFETANNNMQATALNFAIRYRKDIREGMFVEFEDERYRIVAIGGFEFKKDFIGMKTVKAEAIGL